jgi:nucleoid-associated protein YgaU
VASAFLVVDPSASNPAGPSRTGPSGYPTNIALDLDRPVAPYLPPPPVAPKAKAPTGNAALLGGSAHREAPDDSYVVRRGDTLWAVAARHLGPSATAADVAREWPRWYAANRAVIGTDPHLILPGTVLHAPAG